MNVFFAKHIFTEVKLSHECMLALCFLEKTCEASSCWVWGEIVDTVGKWDHAGKIAGQGGRT